MIISASRRTDIPALFSEWFYNRIQKGYVFVRNPYNPLQVGRVSLTPDKVDGFVFWTKNAAPSVPGRLQPLQRRTEHEPASLAGRCIPPKSLSGWVQRLERRQVEWGVLRG